MAEDQQRRQIARKLWIKDLLLGTYVKEEGMKPNYIALQDQSKVSRVNLMGVVVSTNPESMPTITLDDGSGRVTIRAFEPHAGMAAVQVGDPILIIGKPREFSKEIYVLPEIVRKITDLTWLEVRKHELNRNPLQPMLPEPGTVIEVVKDDAFVFTENVLKAIRSLDEGPGADTQSVIEHLGVREAEKTIQFLLQSGDIFEVSPGRLKVLE